MDKSFLVSLMMAVMVMIGMYHRSVLHTAISIKWFWAWILCLAIAISLQLFVVFKIAG
jgi:fatty-acid desaturase